jgi:DNA-binding GntR family transcriptional regulator
MTNEEEIRNGFEAQRLLENPLLAGAFQAIEQAILNRLKTCDVGARDMQRDLVVTLQIVSKVQDHLRTHITTGRLAEISKQESLSRRALRRVIG